MSDLSVALKKAFPWIPEIDLLHGGPQAVQQLEGVVVTGIEEADPRLTPMVELAKSLAADPPTNLVAATTDAGHILAFFDPNFEAHLDATLYADARKIGLNVSEGELDAVANTGLEDVGLVPKPTEAGGQP